MVNWVGVRAGYQSAMEARERKEDREFKRKQQERLDEEFKEGKMLRRVKSVSDFLGDRGSRIIKDTEGLNRVKRLLGNVPGANDYLAKLAASPDALKKVISAIETRGNNIGTVPTGQDLMDNIVVIAENYGNESWMKAYEEGVSIGQVLLTDPDSLLEDEVLSSLTSRIGALPAVTRPSVGVEIAPAYLGKIDSEKQRKSFDNSLLAYAGEIVQTGEMSETERADLRTDINNYAENPSALRKRFGPIVLDKLKQTGDPLFIPGLSGELRDYVFIPSDVEKLKKAADTNKRDGAIQLFNSKYGQGAAEYILGM